MDNLINLDFEHENTDRPNGELNVTEPLVDLSEISGEPNSCIQNNIINLTTLNGIESPAIGLVDLTVSNPLENGLPRPSNHDSKDLLLPVGIKEGSKKRQGQPTESACTPSKVAKDEFSNDVQRVSESYFQPYAQGPRPISVFRAVPICPNSNHTVTSAALAGQHQLVNQNVQVGTGILEPTLEAGPIQPIGGGMYQGDKFKFSINLPVQEPAYRHHLRNDEFLKRHYLPENLNLRNEPSITQPTVYDQLIEMFPDINRDFLKGYCDRGMTVTETANLILEMNDYPVRTQKHEVELCNNNFARVPSASGVSVSQPIASEEPSSTEPTVISTPAKESVIQNRFDFIIKIFPDADPTFLETKCNLGENELRAFISEALEKKNYPKLIIKKENESEDDSDLGLYTTNFNVEHFLKIFPEPFSYFMDDKRICERSGHAQEFLKRRYRHHSIKEIAQKYKDYNYNLVKTCDFLDSQPFTRTTKRALYEIHMPEKTNLPFLQEVCFIEHKIQIQTLLDGLAEAKKIAYEQAEEKGELIECLCCYQHVIFEDCATCNEGDLFCKDCIKRSTEIRIGDGCTTFPCLNDCGSNFSLHMLQGLLNARVFSKLLQRIQLDEVKSAGIEGLEICPFCEFATIPPPETNIFTCLNPECLKESCRKCHKVSHIPQRCEEVENDDQAKARKYIEDEMTKALVRECYKCKRSFIKSDGCNKMTCTCGAKMCYICRQPIKDYNHFNGPGGAADNKCPLYSTEKVLHVDAVTAVAKKAKKVISAANPELKMVHDPSKILPSAASVKNTLPPGVQERPDRLLQNLQMFQEQLGQIDQGLRYMQPEVVITDGLQNLANRVEHLFNMVVRREQPPFRNNDDGNLQNPGGFPRNPQDQN